MNPEAKILVVIALGLVIALVTGQVLSRLAVKRRRHKRRLEYDVVKETPMETSENSEGNVERTERKREEKKVDVGPAMPDRMKNGVAHECAAHARAAFAGGAFVEAYYFGCVAKLCGHRQVTALLSQVRIAWQRAGCPSEKELIYEDFSSVESAIGRAMLRIDTGVAKEMGVACLTDLAEDGNEVASDLLKTLPENIANVLH